MTSDYHHCSGHALSNPSDIRWMTLKRHVYSAVGKIGSNWLLHRIHTYIPHALNAHPLATFNLIIHACYPEIPSLHLFSGRRMHHPRLTAVDENILFLTFTASILLYIPVGDVHVLVMSNHTTEYRLRRHGRSTDQDWSFVSKVRGLQFCRRSMIKMKKCLQRSSGYNLSWYSLPLTFSLELSTVKPTVLMESRIRFNWTSARSNF